MKLRKTWSEDDIFGFCNSVNIDVDYNPKDGSVSLDYATAYDARKTAMINITWLFEQSVVFGKIINEIDWEEIYAQELAAKEEDYCEEK